jgi:hypothetical protein
MIKRASWFAAGALAGVAGSEYARHKAKQVVGRYTPAAVVRTTAVQLRGRGRDLVEALREGRHAMREKEAELIARRDGHPTFVEGSGARVIVLDPASLRIPPAGPRRRSRR